MRAGRGGGGEMKTKQGGRERGRARGRERTQTQTQTHRHTDRHAMPMLSHLPNNKLHLLNLVTHCHWVVGSPKERKERRERRRKERETSAKGNGVCFDFLSRPVCPSLPLCHSLSRVHVCRCSLHWCHSWRELPGRRAPCSNSTKKKKKKKKKIQKKTSKQAAQSIH